MGSAAVEPSGALEAGSFRSFTITYTAGYFGIDDTGSLKIVHRFASDMGKPQFSDPAAANYVTAEASNGAILDMRYDGKMNIRPWDKTLYIKVVRGFLRKGDQINVRFGDPRDGSPGMRVQTFCEDTFEFRVQVDAIATYDYVVLPQQPTISIVPGKPAKFVAVLPTQRRAGDEFRLSLKGEDRWGNPSDQCDHSFALRANMAVAGLPDRVIFMPGGFSRIIEGLSVAEAGDLTVELVDDDGEVAARSNPLRLHAELALLPYWGDLHGQSEETIGTNSARDYFDFARNKAFTDMTSHQGNDFQITNDFWSDLNALTEEYDEPGRFVAFPGYEWSGNTGLGGDRNVLYLREGEQIHRSSHALVHDHSDLDSDANSAAHLFENLESKDCVVFAHIGGRYADIAMSHDARLERAVEVHSAWGTFEWLVHDAFKQGYRVGIVSNSDGHKGRPGASYPGASMFGSYGGLTCIMADGLNRAAILDAMRKRHHYGTTGSRIIMDVGVQFDSPATQFADDPSNGPTEETKVSSAMMGDILQCNNDEVTLRINVCCGTPLERLEIRNGLDLVETVRPYGQGDLGRRIRILWEGSEYRGRGRETNWDGSAEISGNEIERINPVNFYNLDKTCDLLSPTQISGRGLTTGGHAGVDIWLKDGQSGNLKIDTALAKTKINIADIGLEDLVFDAGGITRRIRVFRLPDESLHRSITVDRRLPIKGDGDNAYYICTTQEDGYLGWSSPIYVFK